jgi:prepilin-type N-terminal cleavage/methylation domain-containing protein
MIIKSKKLAGFTLIEMMVSVTIFTVVAVVVSVGFVNLSLLNKKAQVNRALIDNVNLSLDVMTFKIKEGFDYELLPNDNDGYSLTVKNGSGSEDTIFSLKSLEDGKSCVEMIVGTNSGSCLTSPEVNITTLQFKKYPGVRNKIGIRVRGTIEYRNTQSDFSLQTNVSQRNTL